MLGKIMPKQISQASSPKYRQRYQDDAVTSKTPREGTPVSLSQVLTKSPLPNK